MVKKIFSVFFIVLLISTLNISFWSTPCANACKLNHKYWFCKYKFWDSWLAPAKLPVGACPFEPNKLSTDWTKAYGDIFKESTWWKKVTDLNSWYEWKKLPLYYGWVFVHEMDKVSKANTAVSYTNNLRNTNSKTSYGLSTQEINYLKKILAWKYKTPGWSSGGSSSWFDDFYDESSKNYSNVSYLYNLAYNTTLWPSYWTKNSKIESYPIYGFNKLYLEEFYNSSGWFKYPSNDRLLIKAAWIAWVDNQTEFKYAGKTVMMSRLLGFVYWFLDDKNDLAKIRLYGAFKEKYNQWKDLSLTNNYFYYDAMFGDFWPKILTGDTLYYIQWLNLSSHWILGNRHDIAYILGKAVWLYGFDGLSNWIFIKPKSWLIWRWKKSDTEYEVYYIDNWKTINDKDLKKYVKDINKLADLEKISPSTSYITDVWYYNKIPKENISDINGSNLRNVLLSLYKYKSSNGYFITGRNWKFYIGTTNYDKKYFNNSYNATYGSTSRYNFWSTGEYLNLLRKWINYFPKYKKYEVKLTTDNVWPDIILAFNKNVKTRLKNKNVNINNIEFNQLDFALWQTGTTYYINSNANNSTVNDSAFILIDCRWKNNCEPDPTVNLSLGNTNVVIEDENKFKGTLKKIFTIDKKNKLAYCKTNYCVLRLPLTTTNKGKYGKKLAKVTIWTKNYKFQWKDKEEVSGTLPTSPTPTSPQVSMPTPTGPADYTMRIDVGNELYWFVMTDATQDSDDIYDQMDNGDLSYKLYPVDKIWYTISVYFPNLDSSYCKELQSKYNCNNKCECDYVDLYKKWFFNKIDKKYIPDVKVKVCSSSWCKQEIIGKINKIFTTTYSEFFGKSDDVKYQLIARNFNSDLADLLKESGNWKLASVWYYWKQYIENVIKAVNWTKKTLYIYFGYKKEDGSFNVKMDYDDWKVYSFKSPVFCTAKYVWPSQASSEDTWSSLGDLVYSPEGKIKKLYGEIVDNDWHTVGSASDYMNNKYASINKNKELVTSSSAKYPVKMQLTVYFNTDICENYDSVLYPNIKICPSKIKITSMYTEKTDDSPVSYRLIAYTTFPWSSCWSISKTKITVDWKEISSSCNIDEDGKIVCDYELPNSLIEKVNKNITIDNIKYPLETKLEITYTNINWKSSTTSKVEDVKYRWTCIWNQPYFEIKEINSDNIVENYWYDPDSYDSILSFIKAIPGNDRRLNRKRFVIEYYGCYAVNNLDFYMKKDTTYLETWWLPNNDVKQLFVWNDTIKVDVNKIFTDANQTAEDRISNPQKKEIILNFGYKKLGIANRPQDIVDKFSDIQNWINNHALDNWLPRPSIDVILGLKLKDKNDKEYESDYINDVKMFGYCYPYPVLIPYYNWSLAIQDNLLPSYYNDNKITLQYRWCEPLSKFDILVYGWILWKQDQDEFKDYRLLGGKEYNWNIDFKDTSLSCNSADIDNDGTPCNSDKDKQAIEAYETFSVKFNFQTDMLKSSGNLEDYVNNITYNFADENNYWYHKEKVLSDYFKTIINSNFFKGILDTWKTAYQSLYALVNDRWFRFKIISKDTDDSNDINEVHKYKWYDTDKEIASGNLKLSNFVYRYKPIIYIDTFKVMYFDPKLGILEDKKTLQNQGVIYIKYHVSPKGYTDVMTDDWWYLKPKLIIQVFDPYNNEIELLRKIVDLPSNKDELQIPLFIDNIYPDGIYTVKAQILDKYDNKIYKDQFYAVFVKKSVPQFSVYVEENPGTSFVKIYDSLNNAYIVDWNSLYNNWTLKAKIYLHNPLMDYQYKIVNWKKCLSFYVNDTNVCVPEDKIKYDNKVGLHYVEIILQENWLNNTIYGGIHEWINTIKFKDKYWQWNIGIYKFNLIYTPNIIAPTPNIVIWKDIILNNLVIKSKKVKDLIAEDKGIKATSIIVQNGDLWLNIWWNIKIYDWTWQQLLSMPTNYDKVRIKNWHLVYVKPNILTVDNTTYTLPNIVVSDYDPINSIWFGLDSNWILYYIKDWKIQQKLEKIVDKPEDIVIQRQFDGSYLVIVVDNGSIKIFNVKNYDKLNYKIIKQWWPTTDFYNSLYTNNVVSIDYKNGIIYYLYNDSDWLEKIWFIMLPEQHIKVNVNGKLLDINLGNTISVPINIVKDYYTPLLTVDTYIDSSWKEYFVFTYSIPDKYNVNITAYTKIWNSTSLESTKSVYNIVPIEKIELYRNNELVYSKILNEDESEGKKAIEFKIPFIDKTQVFVLKAVTTDWKILQYIVPVIKYIFKIPLTVNIDNWHYEAGIKVLTEDWKEIYSVKKDVAVYDNTLYGDILLFNSKYNANWIYTGIDNIGWIKVLLYTNKGLVNLYKPIDEYIAKYAYYAKYLVDYSWKVYNPNNFISKTDLELFKKYVDSQLQGFVKKDNLVDKNFANNLYNYNWDTFGWLFICIDKDTAEKLKFTIAKKYYALYNDLQKIKDNKLKPYVEYLTKEVLDMIKRIKETKIQNCPNINSRFINIKDLLDK